MFIPTGRNDVFSRQKSDFFLNPVSCLLEGLPAQLNCF